MSFFSHDDPHYNAPSLGQQSEKWPIFKVAVLKIDDFDDNRFRESATTDFPRRCVLALAGFKS